MYSRHPNYKIIIIILKSQTISSLANIIERIIKIYEIK